MFRKLVLCAALVVVLNFAHAADFVDLSRYTTIQSYSIPTLGGFGLEASAVTFARNRNSLFFVGDEGLGVVEIRPNGAVLDVLGSMAFDWTGTGSTNNDAEGLTYLGNGKLVVVDERPQIAYQFDFFNGGTVVLNNQPKAAITGSTVSVGNVGTEGISVDPRDGRFFTVKQDNPLQLRGGTIDFASATANMPTLFEGPTALFGVNSFSDVQTLAPIDALTGTAAADNLLVLSLDSRKLIEITRGGVVKSELNLSALTTQAIEGVTVDHLGKIYLVAEHAGSQPSQLFVLTPVPEAETYALMLAGLGLLGLARRRKSSADLHESSPSNVVR